MAKEKRAREVTSPKRRPPVPSRPPASSAGPRPPGAKSLVTLPPPPPSRGRPRADPTVGSEPTGNLWSDVLGHAYRGVEAEARSRRGAIEAARDALFHHCSLHPWNYLSARDVDGRPLVWTKLEGEKGDASSQPYPAHKTYLRLFIEDLHTVTPDCPILLDKARQMMVTWNCLLYMDWECRFTPNRRWLLSKSTEEEAFALITDKLDYVNSNLPAWFQERSPYIHSPRLYARYPAMGSAIKAVAKTAGEREARGGTASGVFIDEAARQENFKKIWQGSVPMATKIFAVTTADIGTPGARFFVELLERGA